VPRGQAPCLASGDLTRAVCRRAPVNGRPAPRGPATHGARIPSASSAGASSKGFSAPSWTPLLSFICAPGEVDVPLSARPSSASPPDPTCRSPAKGGSSHGGTSNTRLRDVAVMQPRQSHRETVGGEGRQRRAATPMPPRGQRMRHSPCSPIAILFIIDLTLLLRRRRVEPAFKAGQGTARAPPERHADGLCVATAASSSPAAFEQRHVLPLPTGDLRLHASTTSSPSPRSCWTTAPRSWLRRLP